MNPVKKFLAWLSGPKSDLALLVILLALLNLVGARAFFRLDLTARQSYSLSAASRETVRTLEQPLSVKVFFSDKLPAPYNTVSRYLTDLLAEYNGAAGKHFTYELVDMSKEDNQKLASGYGLQMIQLQEVKDNEVGFKNAWMGLAIVYADGIETMDALTTTDGLEYRLTTTIARMVAKANTLAGLSDKVNMTLYLTPALGNFGISGLDKVKSSVNAAWSKANAKNMDRLAFTMVEPADTAEVNALSAKYGLPKISWGEPGTASEGAGVIGLVLEYGDRFRSVPLSISRGLFGYGVTGLDTLDTGIADGLKALVTKSAKVGYVTGHGEKSLEDAQNGAANFSSVVSDMYEFEELDLASADIPANMTSLVINGPRAAFTETELYRLDQFVMRGGNVLMLLDAFDEVQDQQAAMYGMPAQYVPINTGLEGLLDAWGVTLGSGYVMDKTCYEARQQGAPSVPLYYVPVIGKEGMNQKNPVSRNLWSVFMLMPAELALKDDLADDVRATPLVTSSKESWVVSDNVNLSPYNIRVPGADEMASRNLSVLLEGRFPSAFSGIPAGFDSADGVGSGDDAAAGDYAAGAADSAAAGSSGSGPVTQAAFISKGLQSGKVIVVGTSAITSSSVMDENGTQPVAIFVRNAVDYLNGNGDLIDMRTKGLSNFPLKNASAAVKGAINVFDLYGLPLLVALAGLFAWRARVAKRRAIRVKYASDDERETAPLTIKARAKEKGTK